MKLSIADKALLKEWGHEERDFHQIEDVVGKTTLQYVSYNPERGSTQVSKISHKKAEELLGRRKYLAGLARSAFHWSASQDVDEISYVLYDSSKYFKDNQF